ncbi:MULTISPECIES: helix-turn-helix domain-containing protein [Salinicola]|nr:MULTISPECIES: helix-turn-helix domain-containing protein [Salinicola]
MKVTHDISLFCPVARALECVGDSWTLLILRDAMHGARRFDEFQRGLGIASSMLTRRLERMVSDELLEKRCYQQHPPRHEYHLTAKGQDLAPVILMLYRWGEHHLPIEANGFYLIDRQTREPVDPILYDRHHQRPLAPGDVRLAPGPDATPAVHARVERMHAAFDRGGISDSQPTMATAAGQTADAASDSIND